MRTLDDALAELAGPGRPFEVVARASDGGEDRSFVNAPATMRDFFDLARGVESTFLVYEDEEWTFAEVMAHVDALGDALVERYSVAKGDRVAIAMRNYPEWVIAFAATLSVGAVAVSMNAWWNGDELDVALRDAEPVVLIADRERAARVAASTAALSLPVIVVRGGDVTGVTRWEDVVVPGPAMPRIELGADDDATIVYTSGTTGEAKGAVSTHGALSQAVMAFASSAALMSFVEESDASSNCFLLVVPLFHVTGCVPVMLSCFSWHFKLIMVHRWTPEEALALIERHHVTYFVGVPTQAWDLLESPALATTDTSSLGVIGGGGAPAPTTLVARVERTFVGRPNIVYGLTETNAYGPRNFGDDYVAHPTSTGRVPTLVLDAEIRDDNSTALPRGASGEIWLRSPTLIRGYWRRPAASAEAIVEGWLRTGDVGRLDDEGFLYVEDRVKDLIIRAGENVPSSVVESAIYEHPDVYEAAVVGLAHERLGEEVAAVVRARPGATLDPEELRAFLAERLAGYMVPARVALTMEPLPRTATGKVLKRELPGRYFDVA